MIILDGYDVTQKEIDDYVETIDKESLKLTNIEVKNEVEIYHNNKLWYVYDKSQTVEQVINRHLVDSIYSLCAEHFSDRLIVEDSSITPPTQEQLQMQKLNDIELVQLEESLKAEAERQALAQKQYDMELLLVELTLGGAV